MANDHNKEKKELDPTSKRHHHDRKQRRKHPPSPSSLSSRENHRAKTETRKRRRHQSSSSSRNKKARRSEEEERSSHSDSMSSHNRNRKRSRKETKKGEKYRRVDDDRRRRRKRKAKDKKTHARKRKSSERKGDDASSSSSSSSSSQEDETVIGPEMKVMESLYMLLSTYPDLISQLPFMLCKMVSSETTFDLSQMSDKGASSALEHFFSKLSLFDVIHNVNGSWGWKKPPFGSSSRDEFLLIKFVKSLMDQCGMDMRSIRRFDEMTSTKATPKPPAAPPPVAKEDPLASAIQSLFQEFEEENKNQSSLAKEIINLCQTLIEGDTVALHGIPNPTLREQLENIMVLIGLEQVEMEDDDDEDEQVNDDNEASNDKAPLMGFSLSEDEQNAEKPMYNLNSVIQSCEAHISHKQDTAIKKANKKPIQGPSLPPSHHTTTTQESDGEDEEGPAPAGTIKAQKRSKQSEYDQAVKQLEKEGKREEWMLTPGAKNEWLQNLYTKPNQMMKTRKFVNKKTREEEEALDPAVVSQIQQIQKEAEEARGPSLLDMHRQKKEKKRFEEKKSGRNWKWNRDRDLDKDRRVDKDALKLVFGGAKDGLKDKFQSGFGRG